MHLAALHANVPRPPGRHRAAVAAHNRILPEAFTEFPGDDLRLHGYVRARALLLHQLPPSLHLLLGVFEEAAVFIAPQQREQRGVAADAELVSAPPFPDQGRLRGTGQIGQFVRQHLTTGLHVDPTRKQVARDRVTWTVRTYRDDPADRVQGRAQAELREKGLALSGGPAPSGVEEWPRSVAGGCRSDQLCAVRTRTPGFAYKLPRDCHRNDA